MTDLPSPTAPRRERAWENPWFMAAFFCLALAVGFFWQSVVIDHDAEQSIDALRAGNVQIGRPGG